MPEHDVDAAQRTAGIGRIGWLRDSAPDWRDGIIAAGVVRRFEPGAVVSQAGEDGTGLVGICTGTVAVLHAMAVPSTPMIHIFGPGTWAGQGPLLTDTQIQMTLVARTAIKALLVPRARVLALLDANPRHWRELGRLALLHSYQATNIAADLLIPNSRARCAATLLRLCDCRFAAPATGISPQIGITQDELGAMANLSRATIGPILHDFVAAGLISVAYRNVVLHRPAQLLEIAERD